jgi:GNAT superfamily N-acetyltransferase
VSEPASSFALPDDIGGRIADWYAELAWRRGTTVVTPDDTSWILLSPEWPHSYANNGILLRADPGADALIAWGDAHLGGAGLDHRYVFALTDLSLATREELTAGGYLCEAEVIQVRPVGSAPIVSPRGIVVEEVPPDAVSALHEALWREEWMPSATPETVRQLVARRTSYTRSGEMVTLLVRDPTTGAPAATTDVCIAGWAAELDGVATREAFRGRGYGDAMVAAALLVAADRGCEFVALTAMADDWPKDWYARRGFVTTGPAWAATRLPPSRVTDLSDRE